MSSEPEHSVQTAGFWIFGFLSVVLAVLKLTVATYWSWWRVMLPLLAFLGHNALYVLAGLLCLRWLKHDEEESTTADKHSLGRLQHCGAAIFLPVFGQLVATCRGTRMGQILACSGRLEVVVLYVVLSLLAHFACWLRIVSKLNQERT